MKCKVCGKESGQYILCRECNEKRNSGEIIKCPICNEWHYKEQPCKTEEKVKTENETTNTVTPIENTIPENVVIDNENYLYNLKTAFMTNNENEYYLGIKEVLPEGYLVFPQINLASFIYRTDSSRYHNELFRNVDFLITDKKYQPLIVIEINDRSHLSKDRKIRDEKVRKICEEAGVPIINLWTSYGVNKEYIYKKIRETLETLPIKRICHSKDNKETTTNNNKSKGCYIATCVYGSYDCGNVWVLRRFRDDVLLNNCFGKIFVNFYYTISPYVVKYFGNFNLFKRFFKVVLDKIVVKLKNKGFEDTPYIDL